MKMKRIVSILRPDQWKKLRELSAATDVRMAAILRRALDEYLERQKRK